MIFASNYISEFIWSWPTCISPYLLNHSLQVESPSNYNPSLQVHLWVYMTWVPNKLGCVGPPSFINYGFNVNLYVVLIAACKCICKFASSCPSSAIVSVLVCHCQAHLWLHSDTMYTEFRYTPCEDGLIHWYTNPSRWMHTEYFSITIFSE